MTHQNPIAPSASADQGVAALLAECAQDYKGAAISRQSTREPLFGAAADTVRDQLREPAELAAAITIGQRMLALYGSVDADIFAYAQAHGGLAEALRILLRALGVPQNDAEAAK